MLEIPTPRHSVFDAVALGIDPAETNKPTIIQERAYSSPIWYTPDDSRAIPAEVLALAQEKAPMVEDLLEAGFVQMTAEEIRDLIGKTLILRNTASGQEFEGMLLDSGKRVLSKAEDLSSGAAAQGLYHGGDPVLMGETGYEIVDDTIVTSDGLRTIVSRLYRNGDSILGARDVDAGRANFEVRFQ